MSPAPRSPASSLYAEVIGDPIVQSKSPAIHGYWLRRLGLDADYRAAHVTAEGLADYLASRRADPLWRGCNVTMPHKQAVIPLLDALDPLAARIGAVNTVVPEDGRLIGYNTDAGGFLEPLRPYLAQQHLFRMARVLGTGGAALARLEAIVHPAVGKVRDLFLLEHAGMPLVVFDVPLLFEKGGWDRVDAIAVVSAPAEVQRVRVLARPGMTPEKFAHVLGLQVPDAEKRARAGYVIDTGAPLEETRKAVRTVIESLRNRAI